MHPYYFNAQYLQQPSLGELSFFDVEKCPRYEFPNLDRAWIAIDCAQSANQHGSYTAFVGGGLCSDFLKVTNVRRGKWRVDEMIAQLCDFNDEVFRTTGIYPEKVIIEKAAGGVGVYDHLRGRLPVEYIVPIGDKETRAASVCYMVNCGKVQLPKNPSRAFTTFEDELKNFPLVASKDYCDAFVHFLAAAVRPSECESHRTEQRRIVTYDALQEQRLLGGSRGSLSSWDTFDNQDDEQAQIEIISHIAQRRSGW